MSAACNPGMGVLVVNYHTSDAVLKCCASIVARRGAVKLAISIVDNSEDESELLRLYEWAADNSLPDVAVWVTPSVRNCGYAGGNNLAFNRLRGEAGVPSTILIANPDVRIIAGSLDRVVSLTAEHGHDVWVAQTSDPAGHNVHTGLSKISRPTGRSHLVRAVAGHAADSIYPGGHFLFLSGEAWMEARGFDDSYFLYSEELDLALRLNARFKDSLCKSTDQIKVSHEGGLSTGQFKGGKSLITYRHASRSRVLLYRKHRSLHHWLVLMIAFRVLMALFVAARSPRAAGAVLRGSFEGLVTPIPRSESP